LAEPIVSFIISAYNGEVFLPECIDGINAQTFQDYEVIVVDDGSDDGTSDILQKWSKENDRVRVLRRKNDGLTSALNLAISHARGKFLARHDADDISSPYRIERQVKFLEDNKDAVLAGSYCVEFTDMHSLISLYCPPDDSEFFKETLRKEGNPLIHGSIMFPKSAFDKLSEGYRFQYSQDYDLYLRLSSLGNLRVVPNVLYGLRNHPSRTAIQSRYLKTHISKLIKQVNGLIPWDSESEAIIRNYGGTEPDWRVLQERIIKSIPVAKEDKIKAQYIMSMIGDNLEKSARIVSIACAIKAISTCPAWWKTWLSLPYAAMGTVLPHSLIGRWRGRSIWSSYRKPCHAATLNEIFAKGLENGK
jgi:glycosyltransferase involved in cell wall biosynthesis